MDRNYDLGLVEIADETFAWLQPDGGWGWSNAGLVAGDGASLLVDTLFDLKLTGSMLDGMAADGVLKRVGRTWAKGDHTVMMAGVGELLELSHRATSRDVFAIGALQAAVWVAEKEAQLYTMKDAMKHVLGL